ncbi:hypothetical protein JCM11491_002610 [Sporobolomyces phaffii]
MTSVASTSSRSPLPAPKPTKTRKISACMSIPLSSRDPCRLSKQRCDRAKPCATCIKKKLPQDCVWNDSEVRQASKNRGQSSENDDLRNEVERLQKLVNVLVDARLPPTITSPHLSPPAYSPGSTESASTVSLVPQPIAPGGGDDDLAERLFNLSISSFSTASTSLDMRRENILSIEEVQDVLQDVPGDPVQHCGSFPFLRQAAPSFDKIVGHLPLLEDSALSEKYYWMPKYVYRSHKEAVYSAHSKKELPDRTWLLSVSLSIVLAALGIGMNCRFTYTRGGGSNEELRAARELIELSAASLSHSNFLGEPSLDAIRALSLLAIFHLSIAPGDEGSLGIALTGLAVQASLQMNLHKDPAQLYPPSSFREAEERRSVIHHVHLLDGIASASYSRGYILLHARDITAAFPLDLHDEELEFAQSAPEGDFGETVLTSLIERFKVSRFSEQVTEELLGASDLLAEFELAFPDPSTAATSGPFSLSPASEPSVDLVTSAAAFDDNFPSPSFFSETAAFTEHAENSLPAFTRDPLESIDPSLLFSPRNWEP